MRLEISSFVDVGVYERERLVIKILFDIDIGSYVVLLSSLSEARNPTAGRKTAYWFPDGKVKTGDLVVLYTKKGEDRKKDIGEGRTTHFYYWGLDGAIWGSSNKTAVILRIADWIHRVSNE